MEFKFLDKPHMSHLRIRSIVAARGITLAQLAKKMNVTPQFLSGVVSEKNSPNVTTLAKVAEALDMPIAALFSDYFEPHSTLVLCPYCGGRINVANNTPR